MDLNDERDFGVGGNTFRAFRGIDRPSALYRDWARKTVGSTRFKVRAQAAVTLAEFESLHQSLCRSIVKYFRKQTGRRLSLAHTSKLVDLFVKRASRLDFGTPRANLNLIANGHVPIDSLVLKMVDTLFSGALCTDGRAMGHIKTQESYRFFQNLIGALMNKVEAPPLYFDFYAWNYLKQLDKPKWRGGPANRHLRTDRRRARGTRMH
jgi:hypothetical protein